MDHDAKLPALEESRHRVRFMGDVTVVWVAVVSARVKLVFMVCPAAKHATAILVSATTEFRVMAIVHVVTVTTVSLAVRHAIAMQESATMVLPVMAIGESSSESQLFFHFTSDCALCVCGIYFVDTCNSPFLYFLTHLCFFKQYVPFWFLWDVVQPLLQLQFRTVQ